MSYCPDCAEKDKQIREQQAEIARLAQTISDLVTGQDVLKQRCDAAIKDAERYRVARDHARLGPHGEWVIIIGDSHNVDAQKQHFDRDLDAAMTKEKP